MKPSALEVRIDGQRGAFDARHVEADLRRHSARGLVFTLGSRAGIFAIKLVTTAILARLLAPADFGLFAMTLIVWSIAQLFTEGGLSRSTIQREAIDHGEVSALFWLNGLSGVVVALLMAATAPLLAAFYGEPGVQGIVLALSLTCVIAGFTRQHDALLARQMRFRSSAGAQLAAVLFGSVAGVLVAFWGGGPWSLVAMGVVPALVRAPLVWWLCPWRPGRPRWNSEVRSMLAFGRSLTAERCLNFVTMNADNLLIGWAWGAGALGIYSRAYQLLLLPVSFITQPAAKVMITALSKLKDDEARFARYYSGALNGLLWAIGPVTALAVACASDVVYVVLGPGWSEVANIFRVLAVASLLQPVCQSLRWLLTSRDQGRRLVIASATTCVINIAAFVVGMRWGVEGVATGYAAASLLMFPWFVMYSLRGSGLTVGQLFRAIRWPALASASIFAAAETARLILTAEGLFTRVPACLFSAAGAVVFLLALLPGMRADLRSVFRLMTDLRGTRMSVDRSSSRKAA